MSDIDAAAAAAYDAERDRTEFSPAQPDDASRIDDDDGSSIGPVDPPEHVKPDHSGRMTH